MVENLTIEEEKAISDLKSLLKRDNVANAPEDKTTLYKFLKARNFNVKQADSMLRKAIEWRKAFQVDTIQTDYVPPEVLKKYISQTFVGFDKEGRPVRYAALGNTDGKGIFRSANKITVLRHIVQAIEEDDIRMKQLTKNNGKLVSQCIYIYDMENMSLAKATHTNSIQLFMDGVCIFQDNYPEHLKNLFIINASLYFTIAFSVIKTILHGGIIDKIRIFGQDGWKEELLKMIDPEVLPAFLGGSRTDPDGNPRCYSIMNFAGNIPESYYLKKNISRFSECPDVTLLTIDRQSSKSISVEVPSAGSVLHWQYETTQYDIGFTLTYESRWGTEKETLLPMQKLETEYEPEKGMYRCDKAGFYILTFDNSYSWFHSKEVYYRTWTTEEVENGSLRRICYE